MRRKTTPSKRRSHVLEVRVSSPRILWFSFLRRFFRFAKFAVILAILAAAGWGVWQAVLHTFHKNPDFRLAMIDINENPIIDALEVAHISGINLSNRPTVFEINMHRVEEILNAHPGIESASVRRDLPDKLVIRVIPRAPKAWIDCPEAGLRAPRTEGGLLVDAKGFPFPCSAAMLEKSADLPVFRLSSTSEVKPIAGKTIAGAEIERCFRLQDAALRADASANRWIDSIRQANSWSMELVTRDGIRATFSFGGHDAQIARFRAALEHSAAKGVSLATINLIPRHNVPYTVRGDVSAPAPRPISTAAPETRSQKDIRALINRN